MKIEIVIKRISDRSTINNNNTCNKSDNTSNNNANTNNIHMIMM